MTLRESDHRIVPKHSAVQAEGDKPSNIGAGKAVGILRDPDLAPPVLSDGTTVITRPDRTSKRAKADPEAVFNNLFSMLTHELLWYAFRRLKSGKSPGVDNVTLEDYEQDLQGNLSDLLERLHRGSYRPKPSLRKNIPKGNGKTRPLGIACVEDKLVRDAGEVAWQPDGSTTELSDQWPAVLRVRAKKPTHGFIFRFEGFGDGQGIGWGAPLTTPLPGELLEGFVSVSGSFSEMQSTDIRVGFLDEWGPWQPVDADGSIVNRVKVSGPAAALYRSINGMNASRNRPGGLASLGNVHSRPRYPKR